MFFPPQLYEVDPKGLAGQLVEICQVDYRPLAAAQTTWVFSFNVPVDRVLLLSHLEGDFQAGAGVVFQSFEAVELLPSTVECGQIYNSGPGVGALGIRAPVKPYAGGYVVRPGNTLLMVATFDLAVAPNTVVMTAQGWLIPRGRIGLAGRG